MDEEKQSGPPKRRKVLRAKDVIPPFDTAREEEGKKAGATEERSVLSSSDLHTLSPSHLPAGHVPPAPVREADRADTGERAGPGPADGAEKLFEKPAPRGMGLEPMNHRQDAHATFQTPSEIPTYDLAEHILAEQRRAAGRRRRAPGQVQEEPTAGPGAADGPMFIPEITSQDLFELQRLVAQIVARDIDRLCQRPAGRGNWNSAIRE